MSGSPIPTDARVLASRMLALTLGDASAAGQVPDWEELYAFSVQQRCAALMWHRSGAAIRAHAPTGVADSWRQRALAIAEHGAALLELTARTQALLADSGIEAVALKGPALALQLYGPPVARTTSDLDFFIPLHQRDLARDVLLAAGWIQEEGGPASKWEVLTRMDAGEKRWLDIFSFVPKTLASGDAPAPESERRDFDNVTVRVHTGPGMPNHLAVHLAKHDFPPLLWFVDFATAWERLTLTERDDARARARQMGTQRYLQWALDRAAAIGRAAAGEHEQLHLLGFTASGRTQPRRWRREIALAGSWRSALRMIVNFLFPETARTPLAFFRRLAVRLRHPRRWLVDRRRFELSQSLAGTATKSRSDEGQ